MPNFRFWIPLDTIEKSVNDKGQRVMKVGGFASTARIDTDQEGLTPTLEGFDISYLKEKGIVNWNHSKSPEAIIGEPTKAEFRPKGLYVESELYEDSPLANKVYDLAEMLNKNSKKRRLGYSVEGKVLERDSLNEKKITKALITNLALTISPKNPDSIVDIIKGEYHELSDEDLLKGIDNTIFDLKANGGEVKYIVDLVREDGMRVTVDENYNIRVDKCLDTDKGRALIKEDVNPELKNQQYLSKAEVFDKIFAIDSVISFQIANEIFETLNTLTMSTTDKKTKITDDVLEKAMKTLKLTSDKAESVINKGHKEDENEEEAEKEYDKEADIKPKVDKKDKAKSKKKEEDDDEDEDDMKKGEIEEDDEEAEEKEEKKPVIKKAIKKAVQSEIIPEPDMEIGKLIKSLAIIAKGTYDLQKQNVEVLEDIKDELQKSHEMIEELLDQPVTTGRKSVRTSSKPVKREFNKGNDDELGEIEKGEDDEIVLSMSRNKQAIVGLLDKYAFEKGFDDELGKALTTFEAGNTILPVAARKFAENKIKIIQ